MKTGVKFTNVKYIVKQEEGIVVCTMDVDMQIYDKIPNSIIVDIKWWKKQFPQINYDGEFKVKGIAKCNKNDKFNETIGKRIAESKAKRQAFSIVANVYNIIYKKVIRDIYFINDITDNCSTAWERENIHLAELGK